MKNVGLIATICLAALVGVAIAAKAAFADAALVGAKQCTSHFLTNEKAHGIPTHLLAAISSAESGRWNDTLGMVLPWPWTINAEGKGFYFDSREEAIAKVHALQRQGVRSIDIGCMQVNLKHHPNAFASVDQAFDPAYNVAYAAKFLRSNYDESRSWTRAAAAYHSKTPKYGNVYLARIKKSWLSIVNKIQEARAKRGLAAGEYAMDKGGDADASQMAELSRQFAAIDDSAALKSVSSPKSTTQASAAKQNRRSIRVIQVKDRAVSNNVMVIRPSYVPSSQKEGTKMAALPAQHSSAENLFVMQKSSTSVTNTANNARETLRAKPKFIFVE